MRKPGNVQEFNKGAWTIEEDQKLINHIRDHGEGSWRTLPKAAGLFRGGKSCRLRWMNYLRPNIKRGNFGQDEDDLIIKLHALLGNRWSLIAGRLPGRTDNEVKSYWNSHLKRKLVSLGLDPNNHRLSRKHPHLQKCNILEAVAMSSESINNDSGTIKTRANFNEQASNVTSCLQNETCGSMNSSLNHQQDNEIGESRTLLLFI